jgi:cellulose biosynthesis protein BcsQ
MSSYTFWNNKGGVGKSSICFMAASEYAYRHPDTDVYVIDLCSQAGVSSILLGGYLNSPQALDSLSSKTPRATVAGYLEARLNSPFKMIQDISPYICKPKKFNPQIPENLSLICGDNFIEIIAEAIRQTSQLSIPDDAWTQVLTWVHDLIVALRKYSGERETIFLIDCSPTFTIYTQLGLVAADYLVIPFTADETSFFGIQNILALVYGITVSYAATYARIAFAKNAKEEGVHVPKLHSFVRKKITLYGGEQAQNASENVNKKIKQMVDDIHKKHRHIFANPKELPSKSFIEMPEAHDIVSIATTTGTPFHKLKAGDNIIGSDIVQLNPDLLQRYGDALTEFVNYL